MLAVGAPAYNYNGRKGAVYVYEQDAYTLTDFISPVVLYSDSPDDIKFGYAMEFSGTMLLVGAPDDKNVGGTRLGSVFQFKHDGASWVQKGKLFPIGVKAAAVPHFFLHFVEFKSLVYPEHHHRQSCSSAWS